MLIFFKKIHVKSTTNFQGLLYICLVLSSCVEIYKKFPSVNSLLWVQTLTRYLQRTISKWGQSDKYPAAWICCTRTKRIQAPGRPPFITLHQLPLAQLKSLVSSKNFTHFDSLLLALLHNIVLCHAGIVHYNKLKPVLVRLTQHNPDLCASNSYKLKYVPFDYFMHSDII